MGLRGGRAVVLGGGGVVGVAWESGLVAGLLEGGVDLRDAEGFVGTSAGSIVGARLASGQDLREPAPPVRPAMPAEGPDLVTLGEVFAKWSAAETMTAALMREIGRLALEARTAPETVWVQSIARSTGLDDWPARPYRCVGVDCERGEMRVFDAASGAPFARAAAASCAVPGMFPPVTIDGRRYMDGGVRSGTSADVLLEDAPRLVLALAPICEGTASFGALAERQLDAELAALAALEQAGAVSVKVVPEAREKVAFGDNLMDPQAAEAAREAGCARGRELAGAIAERWAG